MKCPEVVGILEVFVSGEPDERLTSAVESHIAVCEKCEVRLGELTHEREVYSHFLFDVEPPNYLAAKFAEKLAFVEPLPQDEVLNSSIGKKFASLFARTGLRRAFAGLTLVVGLAFGAWFLSRTVERNAIVSNVPKQNLPVAIATPQMDDLFVTPTPVRTRPGEAKKTSGLATPAAEKRLAEAKPRLERAENDQKTAIRQKTEIDPQLAEFREFAAETDKQIEKVELLLRSFRNARYAEGRDEYDIEYETALAQRLLARNDELRRKATQLRAGFADEMLGRIEPYLIGIANLETNPTDQDVLEIKQRVRNENIIASLQGF